MKYSTNTSINPPVNNPEISCSLGVLAWLIYGIQLGDYAIILSNAITLALTTSILSVKIYHTLYKKT